MRFVYRLHHEIHARDVLVEDGFVHFLFFLQPGVETLVVQPTIKEETSVDVAHAGQEEEGRQVDLEGWVRRVYLCCSCGP